MRTAVLVALALGVVAAYVYRDTLREWSRKAQYAAGRRVVRYVKAKAKEPAPSRDGHPMDALGEPFAQGALDELAGADGLGSTLARFAVEAGI